MTRYAARGARAGAHRAHRVRGGARRVPVTLALSPLAPRSVGPASCEPAPRCRGRPRRARPGVAAVALAAFVPAAPGPLARRGARRASRPRVAPGVQLRPMRWRGPGAADARRRVRMAIPGRVRHRRRPRGRPWAWAPSRRGGRRGALTVPRASSTCWGRPACSDRTWDFASVQGHGTRGGDLRACEPTRRSRPRRRRGGDSRSAHALGVAAYDPIKGAHSPAVLARRVRRSLTKGCSARGRSARRRDSEIASACAARVAHRAHRRRRGFLPRRVSSPSARARRCGSARSSSSCRGRSVVVCSCGSPRGADREAVLDRLEHTTTWAGLAFPGRSSIWRAFVACRSPSRSWSRSRPPGRSCARSCSPSTPGAGSWRSSRRSASREDSGRDRGLARDDDRRRRSGVGLPIGVASGRWAWNLVAEHLGVAPEVVTPIPATLLVVPAVLVLVNVAAAVPARLASRTPPAVVLRAE